MSDPILGVCVFLSHQQKRSGMDGEGRVKRERGQRPMNPGPGEVTLSGYGFSSGAPVSVL